MRRRARPARILGTWTRSSGCWRRRGAHSVTKVIGVMGGICWSTAVCFLRDRTKSKRPTRGIALWIPVTLYILGDVLIATFTLIPFIALSVSIMGLNGWIGGLGIILLMGLVG